MNHCILVELSKKSIAFSYYTNDIDKFEPYGDELVKPLAVWFSGSSVIIGTDAKNEAQRGTPNAFYDLFGLMERQEHFSYANEKHEYNKLILYTIKAGLKEFFIRVMLNTQGTLDENIANLPLLLSFGSDVELNERNVLMNQLRGNGFGNICEINEDFYAICSFCKGEALKKQLSLILSSDGEDIYGNIYQGDHSVDYFVYRNAGVDPRVDKLAKLVWERTQAESDWLEIDQEMPELRTAAIKFIQSGSIECNDALVLSNGYSYSYYLTREDLSLYNQVDGGHLVREIIDHVVQFGDKNSCLVILKDKAVDNQYLQDLLLPDFPHLKIMDRGNRTIVRQKLLNWCKEKSFVFTQENSKKKVRLVTEVQQESNVPTKRDERDLRVLLLTLETCLNNGDTERAYSEAKAFLDGMHQRQISVFDAQVETLLSKMKGMVKKVAQSVNSYSPEKKEAINSIVQSVSVSAKEKSIQEPSKLDNRDFKILQKSVETFIKNGNFDKAKAEINTFLKQMHDKSVIAFDQEITKMMHVLENVPPSVKEESQVCQNNVKQASSAIVASDRATDASSISLEKKARILMQQLNFKEARELYREAKCQEQVEDCILLIKWKRMLPYYKQEVSATIKDRNVEKAKARVKDIQILIAIYRKYGIDTTDLDILRSEYKQVK